MEKKQKKVLFVATVASHIKAFHLPYLKLFQEKGYKTYVAANWNIIGEDKLDYCDVFIQIPIQRSPFSLKNIIAYKELNRIINNECFDIVHCHTPVGSVIARLAAKHSRKKNHTMVIYTCHGFHFYKGSSLVNWLLFYPIEKYLAKYTDTIITINKEDYNLVKNHFSKRIKDIKYIPGIGVDLNKFENNIVKYKYNLLRKQLDIPTNAFVIIYPARICCEKNQKLILDFMKRIDDKNIFLILPGKDETNGYYEEYVSKNNISNVIFLGKRDDIPELLNISDLLIASSLREGFGINLVEALSAGIPVIAVDNRGHREIVIDGVNGFLIKNNVNDLVEKFNLMYLNKKIYSELKNNCKSSVNKFDLSNSIEEMKKIYNLE